MAKIVSDLEVHENNLLFDDLCNLISKYLVHFMIINLQLDSHLIGTALFTND